MSDLSAAAAAVGAPEELVQRSAEARAQANGTSVEEVLAAWAGGGSPAAAAPSEPEASEETADTDESPQEAPAEEPAAAEQTESAPPVPAVAQPAATAATPTVPPTPEKVTAEEAVNYPVVVTVPTAGIKEKTNFAVPGWLVALLMIVPALGLIGLVGGAEVVCNEATELQMDRQTGNLVNCDGSEFEGRQVGGGAADFIAIGEGLFPQHCASCHGANGEGGVGPALAAVTGTFGSCTDHNEWVHSGTAGFQAQGIGTYGDTGTPVGGGGNMPGFEGTLSDEEIASVVAFERVRFGGGNPEETLADCGLVEAEGGEGEGEGATETTVPAEG
ncbi:MAG: c-type cytochrome [Acidimicrobiia bacterium]|nr:c-type cytochrome [Acidimicrobiia bacterium]